MTEILDFCVGVGSVFLLGVVVGVKVNVLYARRQNRTLALIREDLLSLAGRIQDAMSNVREIKP